MPIFFTKALQIHHDPTSNLDHVLLPSLKLDLTLKPNQIPGSL